MLICCSARLIKEMGLSKPQLIDTKNITDISLSTWYARLFFYNRKKCLLFTNTKTLFSFVVRDARRQQIKNLHELFMRGLVETLKNENFAPDEIEKVMFICKDFKYGKSTDRSVIGSMNDLILQYESYIYTRSLRGNLDFADIGRELNRIPFSPLKMKYAIEAFREALKQHTSYNL
jgi:hypothetical protein